MKDSNSENKRIAKNTLMLYFRMALILVVGLYTSRVVLQTLGIEDFGIYNLVGGFVTMLAYLNSVFVDSTQRFISYALGFGDERNTKEVFSTSITIHLFISIIILILAETLGLWFLNSKLVIDPSRLYAANWVYQCAVMSLLVTIVSIPYKSSIVAHEHMQLYAYVSIVEVFLKLGIVYMLVVIPCDRLILYSILHLLVSIIIPIWFVIYCRIKFHECRFRLGFNKRMLKEISSYSGWVLVGNLGFSFKDQLSNIIMNLFLGTSINASRGVATQVNGIVTSFANNFLMALSPQITKQYASGNILRSAELVYAGARYSIFLMAVISIPFILNVNYLLQLWLGNVPLYTAEFITITLIASILYASTRTLTVALQATGNIKAFQIGVSIIMLSELPLAYFALQKGYTPYVALLPAILTNAVGFFYRVALLRKQIPEYEARTLILSAFIKPIFLMLIVYVICNCIRNMLPFSGFVLLCTSSFVSIILSIVMIYMIGINKDERFYILTAIKKIRK